MAMEMNISHGSLRVRVLRIKERLQKMYKRRLEESTTPNGQGEDKMLTAILTAFLCGLLCGLFTPQIVRIHQHCDPSIASRAIRD
jgi:hypothetical protein